MNGFYKAQRLSQLRRLKSDREHLYDRLGRIGFVPDKDMRERLEGIRIDLGSRIDETYEQIKELENEILGAIRE